ncbi:hypothetical protein BROUX41_002275 [Berkeleyomyces rouxiae]|uniref:uncharacterized protein n=1 Tax=Berkeleyomyces rouxiae TaxID=2035830 RepID=UPI003B80EDF5
MSSSTTSAFPLPQRTKTFDFLQSLRASTASQVLPSQPAPAQTAADTNAIIPRSTRFSGTIEDLRKSITSFSIRSSDSESDHDYYPSRGGASRSRWSSISGAASVVSGAASVISGTTTATTIGSGARTPSVLSHEDAAALRHRNKAAVAAAARRKYDARCRKWALERQLRDRYICECEKARADRHRQNVLANPRFEAALDEANSNLLVQSMFLKRLSVQANLLVDGSDVPGKEAAASKPTHEDLQRAMKETSEALMSLIR